jgi:membrane protease YdiL (CAAX protease family)
MLFIGASLASLLGGVLTAAFGGSPFLITIVAGTLNSVWWILGYQRFSRRRGWVGIAVRFQPIKRRALLVSAGGGIALIVLISVLAEAIRLSGIDIGENPSRAILPTYLGQLPFAVAFIVVLGPAAEELIFRGLLLDWLKQKIAVWAAVLLISLLFALLHNNSFKSGIIGWIAFTDRFLLGVAASFLALRYESLRASFVMHATNNGIACIASVLLSHSSQS